MALQTTTNINLDFNDEKYIVLKAKQYDSSSRWITITCYDNGKLFNLSTNQHTAYIRYKKPDNTGVLNTCRINSKGEVLVELTEQMLAIEGICYADLIIVNKGKAIVNVDTGEIITVDNSAILSTMKFCVQVYKSAFDNSVLDSAYESDVINETLKMANANYTEVIQLAKSYAIGDAEDVRENEDFDNSKYYSQMSKSYAIGDLDGSTGVEDRDNEGIDNAEYYSRLAKSYAKGGLDGDTNTKDRDEENTDNAEYYSRLSKSWAKGDLDGSTNTRNDEGVDNAHYYSEMSKSYAVGGTGLDARENEDVNNAEYYSRLAKSYTMGDFDGSTNTRNDEGAENAKTYMETTEDYRDESKTYMETTEDYRDESKKYMEDSEVFKNKANDSAVLSQRYAVGGTNTVEGEDTDNAKYYYELTRSYTKGDGYVRENEGLDNAEYFYYGAQVYWKYAQSYAVGGTNTRSYEDTDNAKYYSQIAQNASDRASMSESNAQTYMETTKTYMDNSETYMNNASDSADSADISKTNAAESANRAADIANDMADLVISVENVENNAKIAEDSASLAQESADTAKEYSNQSSSFAEEAHDYMSSASILKSKVEEYYKQISGVAGLNAMLSFKGTVSFDELGNIYDSGDVSVGDLYAIEGYFSTDETFVESEVAYSGQITFVYYTSDGLWDCFESGIVTEIYLGSGNPVTGTVFITPENIGAVNVDDKATVNEVKEFLGI